MYFPPGFDRDSAIALGKLVEGAYDLYKGGGAGWPLAAPYGSAAQFSGIPFTGNQPEVFGFTAVDTKTGIAYVVFRGTQSPADWFANLKFQQMKHPWGRVDAGFGGAYDSCSGAVLKGLDALGAAAPIAEVRVTGHSLGAALATLCAADIAINRPNLPRPLLCTFASPRVGDLAFAKAFAATIPVAWRIVNTEDLVNTVALATPLIEVMKVPALVEAALPFFSHLNYQHVGIPIDFTDHRGDVVGNHGMATYLAALAA